MLQAEHKHENNLNTLLMALNPGVTGFVTFARGPLK